LGHWFCRRLSIERLRVQRLRFTHENERSLNEAMREAFPVLTGSRGLVKAMIGVADTGSVPERMISSGCLARI